MTLSSLPRISPLVDRLVRLDTGGHWVVSCYLKLEPRDRVRRKYRIKFKNRAKARLTDLERLKLGRSERDLIERDLERVRAYLDEPGNLPTGRGVAVFASEPIGLFEAVTLPRVFRSRLVIDRTPLVRELAALADEFGLVVCAVYDRTSARFFQVTAFGIEELTSLSAGGTTRAGRFHGTSAAAGPGRGIAASGEHNYHQRIRVEKERHYAGIAQRLFDLSRALPHRGFVLAGVGRDAAAVEPHLHPYIRKRVLGTTRLNPKSTTPACVMDAVLEVLHDAERAWEVEHTEHLEEGIGIGWAVNGVEAALRALAQGQVRTLLIDPTYSVAGFRCKGSGRLSTSANACRGEGEADPVSDMIDEAIEEALRQRSQIDVVEDREAQAKLDGLAALLRFKR